MASYLSYNTQPQNPQNWRRTTFSFDQTYEDYEESAQPVNYYDEQYRNGENATYLFGAVECKRAKPSNQLNSSRSELLCSASWSNNYPALQELLQHPIDAMEVNTPDARSYTALHYSCSNGDNDITATLLESGSQANIQDKNGFTPLMHACSQANLEVVTSLVDHGADVNIQNNDGDSALHIACRIGNEEIVEFLLEHGANINQCNLEGVTALHLATASGSVNLVRNILNHGAHTNVADEEGDTPAHWAVREAHPDILKLLVQSGANIELPNEDGESPLQLAMDLGERAMLEFLTRAARKGFKTSADAIDDTTPQFELDFLHV